MEPMATNRPPQTEAPASSSPLPAGGALRWRDHKVRRVAFTTRDMKYVVRALTPLGAYDLALYIWMVASMQYVPGRDGRPATSTVAQSYRALGKSVGMPRPQRATTLTSHVARTVQRLVDAKLITAEKIPGRRVIIRLLRPGTDGPYVMPDMKKGAKVFLSAEFFANGWHATLSKPALALLMVALIEETKQWGDFGAQGRPHTWKMSRDQIEREYRIHHDAIDKAKKELGERGLLFYEFDELNDDQRHFDHMPPHTYLVKPEVWSLNPVEAPRWKIGHRSEGALDGRTMTWLKLHQPQFRRAKSSDGKVLPLVTEDPA
jgi:hypothetical protein